MSIGDSILAQTGVHPFPIGTLDEIREAGFDPRNVGCCAPPAPGVRGCPWAAPSQNNPQGECIFHMPKYGGFRGKAVKNVGVYIKTDASDGHRTQHTYMACHLFIRSMKSRMLHGDWLRQNGQDGETIRIIGQEGDPIWPIIWVQEDEKNPNSRFVLKKGPPDENGKPTHYMENVPAHPKPGQLDLQSVAHLHEMQERQRREAEEGMFVKPGPIELSPEDEEFLKTSPTSKEPPTGAVGSDPL